MSYSGGFDFSDQQSNGADNSHLYTTSTSLIGDYPEQPVHQLPAQYPVSGHTALPIHAGSRQPVQHLPHPSSYGVAGGDMAGGGCQDSRELRITRGQPPNGDVQQGSVQRLEGFERMMTSGFWDTTNYFASSNDEIEHASPSVLWFTRPEFQDAIMETFDIWQRGRTHADSPAVQARPQTRKNFSDTGEMADDEEDNSVAAAGPSKKRAQPKQQTKATKKTSKRNRYQYDPDVSVLTARDVPAYKPDPSLSSPTKCREYLAHADPRNLAKFEIENDDWQNVEKSRVHEFAGKIFDSLLHAYSHDFPKGIELNSSQVKKYHDQQDKATTRIGKLLGVDYGIKRAKAQCQLAVDAVIFFHSNGVSKPTYVGYQWHIRKDKAIDRRFRLDLDSICSIRLEKLVDVAKANKLIAEDILEGNNFERIAQDPSEYLLLKFSFAKSNTTRQEKTDKARARVKEIEKSGIARGKRNATRGKKATVQEDESDDEDMVDEDEDEESDYDVDSDSDEEYAPKSNSRKRVRIA